MSTTSSPSNGKTYFDLHITGLGYLNRIREVKPKKGDPFLACDIAALNGSSDDTSYVRFDTRVSGAEAQHLVRRCMKAVEAERKVLIGFRLGDLWTDTFTYSKGQKAGQTGVSLKARLLFVSWIKVDGELVYKAEPKSTEGSDSAPAVPEAASATVTPQATQPQADDSDAESQTSQPQALAPEVDSGDDQSSFDAPASNVAEAF